VSFSFAAIDRSRAVDLFLHSLTKLRTDDDGLQSGHDLEDLNTIAFLCGVVRIFADAHSETVEDMLLAHLADATEALLVSSVVPTDNDVSGKWWRARRSRGMSARWFMMSASAVLAGGTPTRRTLDRREIYPRRPNFDRWTRPTKATAVSRGERLAATTAQCA
jgi:hypothetical protein